MKLDEGKIMEIIITAIIASIFTCILTLFSLKFLWYCMVKRGLEKYILKINKIQEILEFEWKGAFTNCGGDYHDNCDCEFSRICKHDLRRSELVKELKNICY
jgi:hypothetical protein